MNPVPAAAARNSSSAVAADLVRRLLGPPVSGVRIAGACASGILLALAYPRPGISGLAWVALVPLLAATLPARSCPRPWRLGFLAGLFWAVPNLAWLRYVTVPGWLTLAAYVAVYPALWAAAAARWADDRAGEGSPIRDVGAALLAAAWWVGLEYVRAHLFTGFPWNFLGTSQYREIAVIQVARIGGVYAVSFLVAFLNVALVLSARRWFRQRGGRRQLMPHLSFVAALLLVALAVGYGIRVAVAEGRGPTRSAAVALVQGNIPQQQKWDEAFGRFILDRYESLTRQAAAAGADLIVWPESSTPDDVRYDLASFAAVTRLVDDTGVPLLVGSGDFRVEDGKDVFTNTAFLFMRGDQPGAIRYTSYDKIHLVPFGEYVPLDNLGVTRLLTPIAGSFRPGSEVTVFDLGDGAAFSTLICFEDVFSELAREGVRRGARFLVNITNDAWYKRSSGAFQHAANAVFRAVETGAPLVRAANTGVTCFIDRFGRVERVLEGAEPGDIWVNGFLSGRVEWPVEPRLTFYTRYGDVGPLLGLVAGIAAHGPFLLRRCRRRAVSEVKPS